MDSLSGSSLPQKIQSNPNSSILDLKSRLSAVKIPEPVKPIAGRRMSSAEGKTVISKKIVTGDVGYVLEDVPHLTDYLPDLPVSFCILCIALFFAHSWVLASFYLFIYILFWWKGLYLFDIGFAIINMIIEEREHLTGVIFVTFESLLALFLFSCKKLGFSVYTFWGALFSRLVQFTE